MRRLRKKRYQNWELESCPNDENIVCLKPPLNDDLQAVMQQQKEKIEILKQLLIDTGISECQILQAIGEEPVDSQAKDEIVGASVVGTVHTAEPTKNSFELHKVEEVQLCSQQNLDDNDGQIDSTFAVEQIEVDEGQQAQGSPIPSDDDDDSLYSFRQYQGVYDAVEVYGNNFSLRQIFEDVGAQMLSVGDAAQQVLSNFWRIGDVVENFDDFISSQLSYFDIVSCIKVSQQIIVTQLHDPEIYLLIDFLERALNEARLIAPQSDYNWIDNYLQNFSDFVQILLADQDENSSICVFWEVPFKQDQQHFHFNNARKQLIVLLNLLDNLVGKLVVMDN